VSYEKLVTNPEETWVEVFRYLDLSFDRAAPELFGDFELAGRWGDGSGAEKYTEVSSDPPRDGGRP
jgi:hypothetical protein